MGALSGKSFLGKAGFHFAETKAFVSEENVRRIWQVG